MRRIVLMLLTSFVCAQDVRLPATFPLPQPKPPSAWPLWNGKPSPTNMSILRDWKFYVPTAGQGLGTIFDIEMTKAGIGHHRCVEGNRNFPAYPSRAELYKWNAVEFGAVTGLRFLARKAGAPAWIDGGMAAYATGVHLDGGIRWRTECW